MKRLRCLIVLFVLAAVCSAHAEQLTSFKFAGQVVDPKGNPIAGAKVTATYRIKKGFGYIDDVTTDADGKFVMNRATAISGADPASVAGDPIQIEVTHNDFLRGVLSDLGQMTDEGRANLTIKLDEGKMVAGMLVDPAGKPVEGVLVQAKFAQDYRFRKAVLTDAQGRFALKGLPDIHASVSAVVTDTSAPLLSAGVTLEPTEFANPLTLKLQEIKLPQDKLVHELFGMKLVDVDDHVHDAFHLDYSRGVLVLDPGSEYQRFNIGELKRGDCFWMAGAQKVKDFDEFCRTIVSASQPQPNSALSGCRVVYGFDRVDFSGTNTQYMQLTSEDLAKLQTLAP
jgi:hypothetical protein